MLPSIFNNNEIATDDDRFALELIFQSQQTYQLAKMNKLEESKVPLKFVPVMLTIVPLNNQTYYCRPSWIAFTLINNGPGGLSIWMNDDNDPGTDGIIVPGATIRTDMIYPIIRKLHFKATGGVCQVSIHATEGKPDFKKSLVR